MREIRTAHELRSLGGNRIGGYAAVFDSESEDLGGFIEVVKPGAFSRSLAGSPDVVALVHHRPELVLGRTSAGTLRLNQDNRGLAFEVDLPDTQTGRDIMVSIDRRDIKGASFAFTVPQRGDNWTFTDERALRELIDVDLHDITMTAIPAYKDTEVARRSLESLRLGGIHLMLAKRYMETVR